MSTVIDNTPVQEYNLNGVPILVKREDLCSPYPGPQFSKIRGVYAHIKNRPEDTIGVLDTYHSKAGWAVSYVCRELGKQCINFWPEYKADVVKYHGHPVPFLRQQQQQAASLGAQLVAIPAGRSFILFNKARSLLRSTYANSYMMPNALKLAESVTENAAEAARTPLPGHGTVVISISSGTVAAGVMSGLTGPGKNYRFLLHMGYQRSEDAVRAYIQSQALTPVTFGLIDEGYEYKDEAKGIAAPFPCNPHYDLKAWKWLSKWANTLDPPVIFWNIGS